jgi:hypothetical protein
MSLTELTVRLLLLFLPGIICYLTVDALIVHRERKVHEIFLFSFVYGLLSYSIYFLIASFFTVVAGRLHVPLPPAQLSILQCLCDNKTAINWVEVGLATGLAPFLGVLISVAHEKSWLYRAARWLKITKKLGPANVWTFVVNAPEAKWATVRDLPNNLMFQGYVLAFSDLEEPAEVFLTNVNVYNEKTGQLLYSIKLTACI